MLKRQFSTAARAVGNKNRCTGFYILLIQLRENCDKGSRRRFVGMDRSFSFLIKSYFHNYPKVKFLRLLHFGKSDGRCGFDRLFSFS